MNCLALPYHTKRGEAYKNYMYIDIFCNHGGKSEGNNKSENCGYKMKLKLYVGKEIIIEEILDKTNPKEDEHSHKMTTDYVFMKNNMVLK